MLNNKAIKAFKKSIYKGKAIKKFERDGTSSGDKRRCAKTQKNNNEPIGYVRWPCTMKERGAFMS